MEISKEEYAYLIRQSVILEVIKRYISKNDYVSKSFLTDLLGIEEAEDK